MKNEWKLGERKEVGDASSGAPKEVGDESRGAPKEIRVSPFKLRKTSN